MLLQCDRSTELLERSGVSQRHSMAVCPLNVDLPARFASESHLAAWNGELTALGTFLGGIQELLT